MIPHLPLRPGQGRQAVHPGLRRRARAHRPHAARRADAHARRSRRHALVPPSCREGVCGSDAMNINGKNGLACITKLKDVKEPVELRPLPGPAGDPRPHRGHDPVLQAVPLDQAVPRQRHAAAGARAPAVARGPRGAQRALRMHPVRVLLDGVPVVLVEPGQVRRSGGAALRPIASSPTAATRTSRAPRQSRGSRTACSAATRS